MKKLPFKRDPTKDKVTVICQNEEVSPYSRCAFCKFCKGVQVSSRIITSPIKKAYEDHGKGLITDDNLMEAQLLFNVLIRDGNAIVCDNESDCGFVHLNND